MKLDRLELRFQNDSPKLMITGLVGEHLCQSTHEFDLSTMHLLANYSCCAACLAPLMQVFHQPPQTHLLMERNIPNCTGRVDSRSGGLQRLQGLSTLGFRFREGILLVQVSHDGPNGISHLCRPWCDSGPCNGGPLTATLERKSDACGEEATADPSAGPERSGTHGFPEECVAATRSPPLGASQKGEQGAPFLLTEPCHVTARTARKHEEFRNADIAWHIMHPGSSRVDIAHACLHCVTFTKKSLSPRTAVTHADSAQEHRWRRRVHCTTVSRRRCFKSGGCRAAGTSRLCTRRGRKHLLKFVGLNKVSKQGTTASTTGTAWTAGIAGTSSGKGTGTAWTSLTSTAIAHKHKTNQNMEGTQTHTHTNMHADSCTTLSISPDDNCVCNPSLNICMTTSTRCLLFVVACRLEA